MSEVAFMRLKEVREEHDLTQVQIAAFLGDSLTGAAEHKGNSLHDGSGDKGDKIKHVQLSPFRVC